MHDSHSRASHGDGGNFSESRRFCNCEAICRLWAGVWLVCEYEEKGNDGGTQAATTDESIIPLREKQQCSLSEASIPDLLLSGCVATKLERASPSLGRPCYLSQPFLSNSGG
jgi:hypothetical protein